MAVASAAAILLAALVAAQAVTGAAPVERRCDSIGGVCIERPASHATVPAAGFALGGVPAFDDSSNCEEGGLQVLQGGRHLCV